MHLHSFICWGYCVLSMWTSGTVFVFYFVLSGNDTVVFIGAESKKPPAQCILKGEDHLHM